MRSWISFLVVASIACACGACSDKTVFVRDGLKGTCVKPPPDVVASGATLNLDATVTKVVEAAKVNAGANVTYQRVRAEIPNLYALQVLDFRICLQYGNGVLTREQYQERALGVLKLVEEGLKSGDKSAENDPMLVKARELYREFHAATDGRTPPIAEAAFSRVHALIEYFREASPTNGHALYYAGEVARKRGLDELSHESFHRYLDVEQTLADTESGGAISAEVCYQRRQGYCPQRTGWIAHLLANDYFAEASKVNTAAARQRTLLQRAQELVKRSRAKYPPGFLQLKSTDELEAAIAGLGATSD